MSSTTTLTRATPTFLLHSPHVPTTPQIDPTRLNDSLHHSCQWGNMGPDGSGMNRLSLNVNDAQVRRWLIEELKSLDCEVKVDAMGNIFGIYPGQDSSLAPIGMGSHLDTQPIGGRYDGILGVHCGLEVIRAIRKSGYKTHAPLAVINWTNEEGARFIPSMLGSGVWAGRYSTEYGHTRRDMTGTTVLSELKSHGFLGETPSTVHALPLSAHFEVHIEQGPILCDKESGAPVGLVKGIQGFKWFEVELKGRSQHAATPMGRRLDPLKPFAQFALKAERLAIEHGGSVTIGRIGSREMMSTNCVLPSIQFHLDVRHHQLAALFNLTAVLNSALRELLNEGEYEPPTWNVLLEADPVAFAERAVASVRQAMGKRDFKKHELISGAGHDSVHTSSVCDTAMIFVRCHEGLSHCAEEYSSPEDNAEGARVLLDTVLHYDQEVFGAKQ